MGEAVRPQSVYRAYNADVAIVTIRRKAIRAALSATAGAYQTGLVSYFTHRDLFPSLMKVSVSYALRTENDELQFVQDSENSAETIEEFILLGLLANYNRFEFQNPYRMRLDDFVNDSVIKKIVLAVGDTCKLSRDKYVAVQNDMPEGWNIGSTLSYLGLGALTPGSRPSSPILSDEVAKLRFADL